MQPVPCWEKVWALPENAPPGSSLRVFKWVKTDKKQHFSDDEGDGDQPLAPLPDEPEAVEGDDEMDQDEATGSVAANTPVPASREVSEPVVPKEESKPATPKPHPLSISFQPPSPTPATDDGLEDSLKPTRDALSSAVPDITPDSMSIDMSGLGPDGEPFEGTNDLTQLHPSDAILGGPLLEQEGMQEDPFTGPSA
ncbi:hypothetical protein NM688_g2236 [Phlebia brevispora]|uniref:Uncharacterized protein n=1 Tax=Phlebia brevispora TaxID=194682 RepID=A0ACC1T9G2_9APHY|nr:hypothetical protein NM688_g2236 [Phlebia brevispora]